MPNRRSRRRAWALATMLLAGFVLSACSSAPTFVNQDPAPTAEDVPNSQPEVTKDSGLPPESEYLPDEEDSDGLSRADNSTPRHDATPPRYEPDRIWPDSLMIEFPDALGDFTHSSQITHYSNFVTTIYTSPDYQILSVTVAQDYVGYNNRLASYDNLRYVGPAVCGTDNSQSSTEIAWYTCFMVGDDGYIAVTAYSTSGITTQELAGYTEDLYRELTQRVS
ncbi:hypothetical protein [uncultured Agrococcus sp.]|uniref:hypothetical protein n=1 Tax=uncultured Agrococcus sp. TaxID=382258 RepID=UPI0025E188F0|nr:hypothetical protein [uncultured Agrococcus sp.]